jgi:ferredoxin
MKRSVISIDDDKCKGKARLISDLFCDGLGACIGHCPQEAITIEEREAEPYDERRVMENVIKGGDAVVRAHLRHLKDHGQEEYLAQAIAFIRAKGMTVPPIEGEQPGTHTAGGCPGARMVDFRRADTCPGSRTVDMTDEGTGPGGRSPLPGESELRQWPVQLQLVNVNAPYFQDAELVIAADCVPFAHADFHKRFLRGRTLVILCPKLDRMPEAYIEKLAEIFRNNRVKSVTVVHMEVPCCFGLTKLVEEAARRAGKPMAIKDYTVSTKGQLV